jgi:hypothetical protein
MSLGCVGSYKQELKPLSYSGCLIPTLLSSSIPSRQHTS